MPVHDPLLIHWLNVELGEKLPVRVVSSSVEMDLQSGHLLGHVVNVVGVILNGASPLHASELREMDSAINRLHNFSVLRLALSKLGLHMTEKELDSISKGQRGAGSALLLRLKKMYDEKRGAIPSSSSSSAALGLSVSKRSLSPPPRNATSLSQSSRSISPLPQPSSPTRARTLREQQEKVALLMQSSPTAPSGPHSGANSVRARLKATHAPASFAESLIQSGMPLRAALAELRLEPFYKVAEEHAARVEAAAAEEKATRRELHFQHVRRDAQKRRERYDLALSATASALGGGREAGLPLRVHGVSVEDVKLEATLMERARRVEAVKAANDSKDARAGISELEASLQRSGIDPSGPAFDRPSKYQQMAQGGGGARRSYVGAVPPSSTLKAGRGEGIFKTALEGEGIEEISRARTLSSSSSSSSATATIANNSSSKSSSATLEPSDIAYMTDLKERAQEKSAQRRENSARAHFSEAVAETSRASLGLGAGGGGGRSGLTTMLSSPYASAAVSPNYMTAAQHLQEEGFSFRSNLTANSASNEGSAAAPSSTTHTASSHAPLPSQRSKEEILESLRLADERRGLAVDTFFRERREALLSEMSADVPDATAGSHTTTMGADERGGASSSHHQSVALASSTAVFLESGKATILEELFGADGKAGEGLWAWPPTSGASWDVKNEEIDAFLEATGRWSSPSPFSACSFSDAASKGTPGIIGATTKTHAMIEEETKHSEGGKDSPFQVPSTSGDDVLLDALRETEEGPSSVVRSKGGGDPTVNDDSPLFFLPNIIRNVEHAENVLKTTVEEALAHISKVSSSKSSTSSSSSSSSSLSSNFIEEMVAAHYVGDPFFAPPITAFRAPEHSSERELGHEQSSSLLSVQHKRLCLSPLSREASINIAVDAAGRISASLASAATTAVETSADSTASPSSPSAAALVDCILSHLVASQDVMAARLAQRMNLVCITPLSVILFACQFFEKNLNVLLAASYAKYDATDAATATAASTHIEMRLLTSAAIEHLTIASRRYSPFFDVAPPSIEELVTPLHFPPFLRVLQADGMWGKGVIPPHPSGETAPAPHPSGETAPAPHTGGEAPPSPASAAAEEEEFLFAYGAIIAASVGSFLRGAAGLRRQAEKEAAAATAAAAAAILEAEKEKEKKAAAAPAAKGGAKGSANATVGATSASSMSEHLPPLPPLPTGAVSITAQQLQSLLSPAVSSPAEIESFLSEIYNIRVHLAKEVHATVPMIASPSSILANFLGGKKTAGAGGNASAPPSTSSKGGAPLATASKRGVASTSDASSHPSKAYSLTLAYADLEPNVPTGAVATTAAPTLCMALVDLLTATRSHALALGAYVRLTDAFCAAASVNITATTAAGNDGGRKRGRGGFLLYGTVNNGSQLLAVEWALQSKAIHHSPPHTAAVVPSEHAHTSETSIPTPRTLPQLTPLLDAYEEGSWSFPRAGGDAFETWLLLRDAHEGAARAAAAVAAAAAEAAAAAAAQGGKGAAGKANKDAAAANQGASAESNLPPLPPPPPVQGGIDAIFSFSSSSASSSSSPSSQFLLHLAEVHRGVSFDAITGLSVIPPSVSHQQTNESGSAAASEPLQSQGKEEEAGIETTRTATPAVSTIFWSRAPPSLAPSSVLTPLLPFDATSGSASEGRVGSARGSAAAPKGGAPPPAAAAASNKKGGGTGAASTPSSHPQDAGVSLHTGLLSTPIFKALTDSGIAGLHVVLEGGFALTLAQAAAKHTEAAAAAEAEAAATADAASARPASSSKGGGKAASTSASASAPATVSSSVVSSSSSFEVAFHNFYKRRDTVQLLVSQWISSTARFGSVNVPFPSISAASAAAATLEIHSKDLVRCIGSAEAALEGLLYLAAAAPSSQSNSTTAAQTAATTTPEKTAVPPHDPLTRRILQAYARGAAVNPLGNMAQLLMTWSASSRGQCGWVGATLSALGLWRANALERLSAMRGRFFRVLDGAQGDAGASALQASISFPPSLLSLSSSRTAEAPLTSTNLVVEAATSIHHVLLTKVPPPPPSPSTSRVTSLSTVSKASPSPAIISYTLSDGSTSNTHFARLYQELRGAVTAGRPPLGAAACAPFLREARDACHVAWLSAERTMEAAKKTLDELCSGQGGDDTGGIGQDLNSLPPSFVSLLALSSKSAADECSFLLGLGVLLSRLEKDLTVGMATGVHAQLNTIAPPERKEGPSEASVATSNTAGGASTVEATKDSTHAAASSTVPGKSSSSSRPASALQAALSSAASPPLPTSNPSPPIPLPLPERILTQSIDLQVVFEGAHPSLPYSTPPLQPQALERARAYLESSSPPSYPDNSLVYCSSMPTPISTAAEAWNAVSLERFDALSDAISSLRLNGSYASSIASAATRDAERRSAALLEASRCTEDLLQAHEMELFQRCRDALANWTSQRDGDIARVQDLLETQIKAFGGLGMPSRPFGGVSASSLRMEALHSTTRKTSAQPVIGLEPVDFSIPSCKDHSSDNEGGERAGTITRPNDDDTGRLDWSLRSLDSCPSLSGEGEADRAAQLVSSLTATLALVQDFLSRDSAR